MLFSSIQLRFGYFLLFTLGLTACLNKSQQLVSPLSPLLQDPLIKSYFNQSQASSYTEVLRQQTRLGDNLEEIIVNTIADANSTVYVAVQELRLPAIAQALAERYQAGIKVRVIIENIYNRPWESLNPSEAAQLSQQERDRYNNFFSLTDYNIDGNISQDKINLRDALIILSNAEVPLIDDTADGSKGSGLMHHKFLKEKSMLCVRRV